MRLLYTEFAANAVKKLNKENKRMKKWICKVCGYVYEGEEAPEICPLCGVGSEEFELVEE